MVVDTVFFVDAQHFTAERNHLLIALFFGELQKCTLWLALRGVGRHPLSQDHGLRRMQ